MIADINGHSLNYIVQGADNGLPVVLIHGFPFSHRMWEPQLKALPHRCRAIAYDVRGHGGSDVGNGQYTVELIVDDLIGLLDHLAEDRAVPFGGSRNGMAKPLAVVLLSGGMDSCVTAAIAARDHDLALLHASYGQRTERRELRA